MPTQGGGMEIIMKNKMLFNAISTLLAASIVSMSSIAVFAENTATDEQSNSEYSQTPLDDNTEIPSTVSVNISANYFENENNTYNIVFSSLDVLDNLKNFNFKVTLTDAELTIPTFGSDLKTGSYSIEAVGSNSATFKNGSSETLLSGKIVLCSINTSVLPTAENVAFTDFTAIDKDGNTVTFAPTLTVEEGPVVPELSEKEQTAYDAIVALPSISSLSFYEDGTLISVDSLKETVANTVDLYDNLSTAEKANVGEVLTYNMKSTEILTTLPPVVDAMCSVYDVLDLSLKLKDVEDTDIVNHKFIIDVYESIKDTISTENLPNPSNVYTEYEAALSLITSSATKIADKLSAMDYSDKIENVAKQTEVAKPSTKDKYYNEYLECLLTYANDLYADMEENCTDRYKDYMLQELNTKIANIKALQNNISSLPTFEVGNIIRARNYTITVTRKSAAGTTSKINVYVYNENDLKNPIDTSEQTFNASSTKVNITLNALKTKYPSNKNIVISLTYTLDDVTYNLGSQTVLCNKEMANPSPGSSPAVSVPSNDTTVEPTNPSGTVFPEVDDNEDDVKKPVTPEQKELFCDIANYTWASEAIEGLYYAGIINGMEEGVFNPSGNVTREQFCKMVVQLFNVLDYESVSAFNDVDTNAWYAPYISSAIKSGYVQGQSAEYFGVGESIMRQDMATILYRALGSQGKATVLSFNDNDKIADYAYDAIAEFVGLGIINGYEDGTFNPRGTATRAEAAKVIWGVYQIINK